MNDPKTWEQGVDAALAELRRVMLERHQKYGPGNIARFGETGLIVRLNDKIERLINMLDLGRCDFPDDSVDDAFTDIGNYGVIALMWRRGWWTLPADILGQVREPISVLRETVQCDLAPPAIETGIPCDSSTDFRICPDCGGTFCGAHLDPEAHECEGLDEAGSE